MKRLIFTAFILFSALLLCAQENQENRDFHRHEIRVSYGDALGTGIWFSRGFVSYEISASYLFRPVQWFWIGGNLSYFGGGNNLYYRWREYDTHGNFQDFYDSKRKFAFAFAPEVRLSYLNRPSIILYSALSIGFAWENAFDASGQNQLIFHDRLHVTLLGLSVNFGRNRNIFLGGEFGIGYRSVFSAHGGFRF